MAELRSPWLVAVWPGMGAVGHLAGNTLVQLLGARPVTEIPAGGYFGLTAVSVRAGVIESVHQPRTILAEWRNPNGPRDLVILLAESQPTSAERKYSETVLTAAREMGVARVFTFAAMATAVPPAAPARVFAAATDQRLLEELRQHGAETLPHGEIGGMNGFFLSVAAEQGIPGACLLGEMPFFAAGVLNPKSSAAVLRVFAQACGLTLDLRLLDSQAQVVEQQLGMLEKQLQGQRSETREPSATSDVVSRDWRKPERELEFSKADEARIEVLFQDAERDRSSAMLLKSELDRLGVFSRYEDRFLDLFKRAE